MTVQYVRWRKKEGEIAKGPWFQRRTHVVSPESWEGYNSSLKWPIRLRTYTFGWGDTIQLHVRTSKVLHDD